MAQRSIRFPDDLAARAEAEAARLERSFSWLVVQALEAALGRTGGGVQTEPRKPAVPASPRTPAGTTARGRQPKVSHEKPTGPVPIAPLLGRAAHPDDVRVLDPEPMRRVRTAEICRHAINCKCPVCKPPKGGKR